jgi:hypothetical protein
MINNNFFNDMQDQWKKNFNTVDVNEWMKNLKAQNIHFCDLDCSNALHNAMDLAKANAQLVQDNMAHCIEATQNNLKANSLDAVLANNQEVMQNIIFNVAHFSKQMMDKTAQSGIDLYEHYIDLAKEHFNMSNNQNSVDATSSQESSINKNNVKNSKK